MSEVESEAFGGVPPVDPEQIEQIPAQHESLSIGENPGLDMRRAGAKHYNRVLRMLSGIGAAMDLADEGEVLIQNVRFRDDEKPGHLRAYIRKEISEHPGKVITVSVVSLGVVAAGVYGLKYRKKKS
jgi:hypothetical protein